MASYTLIGNASIVQVLSAKVSANMEAVTIQTIPSGVIATMLVSQDAFDKQAAGPVLTTFADNIEAIIGQGKAVGGAGSSELDGSGLMQYAVTFEVGYNPPGAPVGTVTTDVDVPVGLLNSDDALIGRTLFGQATAMIDAAYSNLVALSGSTPAAAPSSAAAAKPATGSSSGA